jgi:hypothetical protein
MCNFYNINNMDLIFVHTEKNSQKKVSTGIKKKEMPWIL